METVIGDQWILRNTFFQHDSFPSITFFNILGDLALLVDTSHPRIRPDLEKGIEQARKILQSRHLFCLQVSGMLLFTL